VLTQKEAEIGLVFSLIRRPGESTEDALARYADLPPIDADDIGDKSLRQLFQVIEQNAADDLATSTRLAAQATGIDEFEIVQRVESVDPDALAVYARDVLHHARQRQIKSAAETAVQAAAKDPDQALDEIAGAFAQIDLASDDGRIGTIEERLKTGHIGLLQLQEEIRSGRPRPRFPLPGLNRLIPLVLPGQVILLTAKSKVGKTAFASQMFDINVASGLRGVYFHFEDTPQVMHLRRVARTQASFYDFANARPKAGYTTAPFYRLLGKAPSGELGVTLTDKELETVEAATKLAESLLDNRGIEVYCAGWPMKRVIRIWRKLHLRLQAKGEKLDFVVIDYLNKADVSLREVGILGMHGARGRDTELVKQTAEALDCVAFLLQQESDEGLPYETRQSLQESQAWISLQRERMLDGSLNPYGKAVVKNANMGETGEVNMRLFPSFMIFGEV